MINCRFGCDHTISEISYTYLRINETAEKAEREVGHNEEGINRNRFYS